MDDGFVLSLDLDGRACHNCNKITRFEIHTNEKHPEYNWERCLDCKWTFTGPAWLKKWKMIKERPKA
jgi:hypothetical protein